MSQNRSDTPPQTDAPEAAGTRLEDTSRVLRFSARLAAEKNLPQVASSLTFTTVLAIVPLLAIVLALFTAFPLFTDFRVALEHFLTANLMPPTVSENVMGYLNQFAAQASGLTAIGILFLLVTSIMLMTTIEKAFNSIWNVRHLQSLRKRILVYWAILSLGPVLVGASLWVTSYVARQSLGQFAAMSTGLSFALSIIPLCVTGLGFSALFVYVPNTQVHWKDALAGGFCTAIALSIMKTGFAYYLVHFPSYTVIYGAFATVPIFLLWIYMSWLAILFGATLAATLPLLRLRLWKKNRQTGAAFVDAIKVLRLLRTAQNTNPPGRSTRFLSAHLRMHRDELLFVLETLQNIGYVAATQGKDDGRWALTCDPAESGLGPIVDTLLINRAQPGFGDDPVLTDGVCTSLIQNRDVLLDEILGKSAATSDTTGIVRHAGSAARDATGENTHA
jgi:membrane protein